MTVLCFQFRLSPESAPGEKTVEIETVDELLAHVKSNPGSTVVIGPGAPAPARIAEQVRAVDAHANVLLTLSPERYAKAEAAEIQLARKAEDLLHVQRSQTNLLSMVAHDIRAPLGVVVGAINELAHQDVGGELNDEQKFLLGLVRRSVERLTRLASNLVFLGRMEAGRVDLKKRVADLRAPVRAVAEDIRRVDAGTSIELVVDLPESPVEALVDGDRFVQILTNLLANAVRFAKKAVRVQLHQTGSDIELRVEDDGPGIPEGALAKIFERFSRLDAPKSGTGLGLAIVRGVVDAHEGIVRAENLQDLDPKTTGARFIVRIPRNNG